MELVNTAQKFSFSFSKLRYGPFREFCQHLTHSDEWNWISSMKFETVRIYLVKWRFWFVVWSKNFATVTSPLLAKKQQPGTCAAHFFVHFFDVVLHDYNVKLISYPDLTLYEINVKLYVNWNMSYVLTGVLSCSYSLFFYTAAHFQLVGRFFSFSHRQFLFFLQRNFSCFFF